MREVIGGDDSMKYQVTKLFTSGILKGLTYTEETSVKFEVGKVYRGIGGSDYKIIKCEEVK